MTSFELTNRRKLNEYMEFCGEKTKLPAEVMGDVKYLFDIASPERNVQCYIRCVLTKMGLFESRNGVILDNLAQQMGHANRKDPMEVLLLILPCGRYVDENRSDMCKMAYTSSKCVYKIGLKLVREPKQVKPE